MVPGHTRTFGCRSTSRTGNNDPMGTEYCNRATVRTLRKQRVLYLRWYCAEYRNKTVKNIIRHVDVFCSSKKKVWIERESTGGRSRSRSSSCEDHENGGDHKKYGLICEHGLDTGFWILGSENGRKGDNPPVFKCFCSWRGFENTSSQRYAESGLAWPSRLSNPRVKNLALFVAHSWRHWVMTPWHRWEQLKDTKQMEHPFCFMLQRVLFCHKQIVCSERKGRQTHWRVSMLSDGWRRCGVWWTPFCMGAQVVCSCLRLLTLYQTLFAQMYFITRDRILRRTSTVKKIFSFPSKRTEGVKREKRWSVWAYLFFTLFVQYISLLLHLVSAFQAPNFQNSHT